METMMDSIILPAFGALATALTYLWRIIHKGHRDTSEKLLKCEQGHVISNEKMLLMAEKVGKLEGRQEGVEALSRSVLREISNSK